MQLEVLNACLAAVLLDRQVERSDAVHKAYPKLSWGHQEEDGYCKLDMKVLHSSAQQLLFFLACQGCISQSASCEAGGQQYQAGSRPFSA